MTLSITPEPHWWSWADIVRHADQLGIPNFQRGAVWDTSNLVALLESIYEQSPCGSFVLWAPNGEGRDSRRHGVPLHGFGFGKEPMWLVDGQQRTRAMLDTFQHLAQAPARPDGWSLVRGADLAAVRAVAGDMLGLTQCETDDSDDSDDSDEDAKNNPHHWMVVLPAMPVFDRGRDPYFGRHSESRNVRRGSMFRFLRPRARTRLHADGKTRPVPPLPVGIVPLVALLSPDGVLHSPPLREAILHTLSGFTGGDIDVVMLDDLLPWGPQFVTGHAYEAPGDSHMPAVSMRWSHILARREEAGVREMVARLSGLFGPEWVAVFERFKRMLDGNSFAVGWLPPSDVSAAIDAYVRINRAGIRVRAEERAMALLSRGRPELLDDLAEFTLRRGGGDSVGDQRALLTHESDRQMGFGVWMTTVTRYTALALLGDYARRWLGVSAIDKDTFGYRLDRMGPNESQAGKKTWARSDYARPGEVIRECAEHATAALLLVDAVLSEELCLDHRMARPSARALQPLIDLLYRVPVGELERLREDVAFRAAIARLLHWTLLAPYIDQPDLEKLIVDLHGIDEQAAGKESAPVKVWEEAGVDLSGRLRAALVLYEASLLAIWHPKHVEMSNRQRRSPLSLASLPASKALTRLALDAFSSEVRDARSLQHPAVGWLYAIERRGNAREFSWEAQVAGFVEKGGKVGLPAPTGAIPTAALLSREDGDFEGGLFPEKQHIVPFAIARQIVDKGGTRSTASPSNAIGNLTWLSRRQNGLDALSDRWTVMDMEREADNLAARGMLAPAAVDGTERAVLDVYQDLSDRVLAGAETWRADREGALRLFAAFCKGRADWIVDQMRAWLEEDLPYEVAWWLGEDGRPRI